MTRIFRRFQRVLWSSTSVRFPVHSAFHSQVHVPFLPLLGRRYVTQIGSGGSSAPSRKQITIASDDGRISWRELSAREKAARATQQSFNLMIILAGIFMTGGVAYLFYSEVLAKDSKTSHFGRAVERIKNDPRCTELLGNSKQIRAHSGRSSNRWSRAISPSSTVGTDRFGNEYFRMHFYVDGPLSSGNVNLKMTKAAGEKDFKYDYLALDVKGHPRLYVEGPDAHNRPSKKGQLRMLGVDWR